LVKWLKSVPVRWACNGGFRECAKSRLKMQNIDFQDFWIIIGFLKEIKSFPGHVIPESKFTVTT
jgi:hypothetical protein